MVAAPPNFALMPPLTSRKCKVPPIFSKVTCPSISRTMTLEPTCVTLRSPRTRLATNWFPTRSRWVMPASWTRALEPTFLTDNSSRTRRAEKSDPIVSIWALPTSRNERSVPILPMTILPSIERNRASLPTRLTSRLAFWGTYKTQSLGQETTT